MRAQETDDFTPGQLDFVPRDRRTQSLRLLISFAIVMVIVLLNGYADGLRNSGYGPLFSLLALAFLCIYVVIRHQQILDLLMTTEHQNLLFSQALGIGSQFYILVRQNGTIVYANQGLRNLFSGRALGESKALEQVFERGGVAKADRERILGSIYNNMLDRLVFSLPMAQSEPVDIILTVEPLPRPSGFMLVRGREYRGERVGTQVMPGALRATSADKLEHLLNSTPIAHYATDAFGRFEYVNEALDHALGFLPGEILDTRLTIGSLLSHQGLTPIEADYQLNDYIGEAVIRTKSGLLIDCLLCQSLIRDEKGKATGATGSIITSAMLGQ